MPRFGRLNIADLTSDAVQEWIADLRRVRGLSHKSAKNCLGILKLIVGKTISSTWEIHLGRSSHPRQRYFTESELRAIVSAATGQHRILFALLAGTGMRSGEAAGLHVGDVDLDHGVVFVRRAVWMGREQTPKTESAVRVIDIDFGLVEMLRDYIGRRTTGYLFATRRETPLVMDDVVKRVLHPLLTRLGIPRGGLHSFRHGRVTILRRRGVSEDLVRAWVGHTTSRTTDLYSHTDQEFEYRRQQVAKAAVNFSPATF
jgi:integrase